MSAKCAVMGMRPVAKVQRAVDRLNRVQRQQQQKRAQANLQAQPCDDQDEISTLKYLPTQEKPVYMWWEEWCPVCKGLLDIVLFAP